MQYQEFLMNVKQNADLNDQKEAERIIEVSLATLGERLHPVYVDKLQSQIPKQLKAFLTERKFSHFTLEEYYKRVAERADIGYSDAVRLSRTVMNELKKNITIGLLEEILRDLPHEFVELFGQEPTTPLSPSAIE